MRFTDLSLMALASLWQRPGRTAMTVAGVLLGTFVLSSTLALSDGVKGMITRQLRKQDTLRRVTVYKTGGVREKDVPARELQLSGEMSDARRARLREAVVRRYRKSGSRASVGLSEAEMSSLRQLPQVEAVTPGLSWAGEAVWDKKRQPAVVLTVAADDASVARRVVAGRTFAGHAAEGVLVSEVVAYRWGFRDEDSVEALIGQTMRVEIGNARPGAAQLLALLDAGGEVPPQKRRALEKLALKVPLALSQMDLSDEERKVLDELRAAPKQGGESQTIVGVFRDLDRGEQGPWDGPVRGYDVLVPPAVARKIQLSRPGGGSAGAPWAVARVRDEGQLKEVESEAGRQGMETFSLAEVVEQMNLTVLMITAACALVALTALVVAGLGITNTMLMSVLQRTHEIGVMKAVGARDSQVMALFLLEGAMVGALGAGLGVLASWLGSFPGDRLAAHLIESRTPMRLEGSVYEFAPWALAVVPLGVTLWTTLAAVSPARRAARIDPIEALRAR